MKNYLKSCRFKPSSHQAQTMELALGVRVKPPSDMEWMDAIRTGAVNILDDHDSRIINTPKSWLILAENMPSPRSMHGIHNPVTVVL